MDFKALPIAAICCIVIVGCNENIIFENKTEKQIVQNSNIYKKQNKRFDIKKENNEEKLDNNDLEFKLKEKKQSYLERLKNIKDEYVKIYLKFQSGEGSIQVLRDISIKSYEESRKILNEIYEDLNKYIPEDKMEKIKEEQLKWIDKKYEQEKNYKESLTDLMLEQKMYYFLEDRCKILLNYLSNAECDVKCDDSKEKEKENIEANIENSQEENKETNISENNISIDEVVAKLHNLLDREDIKTDYILNEDDNYVRDNPNNPLNVNNYYIFRVVDYTEENEGVSPDKHIIVNKENLDVYSYGSDGSMEQLGNIN